MMDQRGHTLPELLVVLVLIGLLAGVAYSFEGLSGRLWREGRAVVEVHRSIRSARTVMTSDIRPACRVEVKSGELTVYYGDGSSVYYELVGDRLLRTVVDEQKVVLNDVLRFDVVSSNDLVTVFVQAGDRMDMTVVWHVALRLGRSR